MRWFVEVVGKLALYFILQIKCLRAAMSMAETLHKYILDLDLQTMNCVVLSYTWETLSWLVSCIPIIKSK